MKDPEYQPAGIVGRGVDLRPPGAGAAVEDVTRDKKKFTAAVRTRVFTLLRAWSIGDHLSALGALDSLDDADGAAWTAERFKGAFEAYRAEHERLRLDPEARNLRHTYVEPSKDGSAWRVDQILVDPDMRNDWLAAFEVDLAASRDAGRPVIRLLRIGELAPAWALTPR